jgi:hypothetical protein
MAERLNAKNNTLKCPRGCTAVGGYPIASTIRGWKLHMTNQHGGFADEQLQAVLGASTKTPEEGKLEFLSEADKPLTPEQVAEFDGAPAPTPSVPVKTEAVSRRLSGKMNKFKKTIADKFPRMIENALRDQPELALSESDRELLTEGVENSLDVLEVDFQVAPISKTLTSPWWALIFPLLALIIVFLPKLPAILELAKAKRAEVENAAKESEPVSVAN